jgi:signal transduction histidine kinase
MKQQIDDISENLHRIAANLRPASLDHLGLLPALSYLVEKISNDFNLAGELEAVGLENRLPSDVETAVYRIVQEALTNVIRHAQATRVDVILKQDQDNLIIIVEDNGKGFDPSVVMNNMMADEHFGLIGIRERVEMLGGTLTLESSKTMGSTVRIEVLHVHSRVDS